MRKKISLGFFILLAVVLATGSASATVYNETIPAGLGTLSYTATVSTISCQEFIGHQLETIHYYDVSYSSFSYTASGATTPLSGSVASVDDPSYIPSQPCPQSSFPPLTLSGSLSGSSLEIIFTPSGQNGGTAVMVGIVYPKYQVQSIIYSAPGNYSTNGFTNGTTDGTATSVGSSFQTGDSSTYSLSMGFLGLGSTLSWTFGNSATTGNSTAVTETIADAAGVSITGPGSSGPNIINHLQDWFIVWINPAVTVHQVGSSAVTYAQGTQFQTAGDPNPGEPEAYQDQVEVEAQAMMANAQGITTVPLEALEQKTMPDGETLPGLASICANLKTSEYLSNSCTASDQCGCVPSDFTGILAQDPLLNYASTESPLNADTSGAAVCGSPTASAKCRYVPVPSSPGSSVQEVELLAGPQTVGGTRPINTFTQSDSDTTTQTLSESDSYTVGSSEEISFKFFGSGVSLKSASQFTYTNSESTGAINGSSNSMQISLSSSTVDCYQEIPIFEDTVYHTFVFTQPTGNNSCP